jgi:anthranilate phosphoribosyltransferase
MNLASALTQAARGALSFEVCRAVVGEVVTAAAGDPGRDVRLAALLGLIAGRGATASEVDGAVAALLDHALPFEHSEHDAVDTCGTGGDGSGTFNVSTATALLVSALGVPVLKHGNRAVSSVSGSADLLEALGISLETSALELARALPYTRFAFLLAPRFHPALRRIAELRRTLGLRTLFNLAAPLANPARVTRQVVGVCDERTAIIVAEVLQRRGARAAYVVFGQAGERVVDELTPCGVCCLRGVGALRDIEVDPLALGIARCDLAALRAEGPAHGAQLVRAAFDGAPGPIADTLALNAAAVLVVAGRARDMVDGVEAARRGLACGVAARQVERLARGGAA